MKEMYSPSADILSDWMEKLFPTKDQGCINFGYWKGLKEPLTLEKRVESQKKLYQEVFKRFQPNCKSVLEVGCGRGHGVAWLREGGYDAYGVDVLPSQIEKCKESYPHLASYFQLGQAELLPFENQSLDTLYSLEAAQHFISFQTFCDESYRVLRNPGKLIVSTFFLKNRSYAQDLEKIIPNNLEGTHNALGVREAMALIQESGFKILPPLSLGKEIFPRYAQWQKMQLGNTPLSALSEERAKWAPYYTGGGEEAHPWVQAFEKGWIDYYILEGYKI